MQPPLLSSSGSAQCEPEPLTISAAQMQAVFFSLWFKCLHQRGPQGSQNPVGRLAALLQCTQTSLTACGQPISHPQAACVLRYISVRYKERRIVGIFYTSSVMSWGQALTVGVLVFLPGGPAPVAHSSGVDQAGHPAATIRARPRRGAVFAPSRPPARARHARRLPVLHVRLCPVFSFHRFACPSPDSVRASHAPAHVCGHVNSDATTKPVAKHHPPLMQHYAPRQLRAICRQVGELCKWRILRVDTAMRVQIVLLSQGALNCCAQVGSVWARRQREGRHLPQQRALPRGRRRAREPRRAGAFPARLLPRT